MSIDESEFDRGDALKSAINAKSKSYGGSGTIRVRHPAVFGEFRPSGDGKAVARRLKSSLAQRLLAIVEDEDDELSEYGTLAGDRLVNAVVGDRDVFVEPGRPGEMLDTAFSMLIDMSGSMKDTADKPCLAATWAIGDTLNAYAGAFSLSAFNEVVLAMKDWREPWRGGDCLTWYRPYGSTLTPQAVRNRLEDLIKRRESRKILFLITDGDIGDLEPIVNASNEAGVEFVVMMIGHEVNTPNAPYLKRFSLVNPNDPKGIAGGMMKAVISLFS